MFIFGLTYNDIVYSNSVLRMRALAMFFFCERGPSRCVAPRGSPVLWNSPFSAVTVTSNRSRYRVNRHHVGCDDHASTKSLSAELHAYT